MEEAAALKEESNNNSNEAAEDKVNNKDESDPFGLDALIPSKMNNDDKTKGKKDTQNKIREEDEENKRFLRSQREALITCLEIAAHRYRIPW